MRQVSLKFCIQMINLSLTNWTCYKLHVCELEPDLIAISESWTHKEITKEMLNLKGYTIVCRSDRTDTLNGRGGGILLYSRLSNVYELTVDKSEQFVHAILSNKEKCSDIHLHVFYRSPNSSLEVNENVQRYVENVPDNSILIGDFNYPEINWSTLSSTQAPGKLFLDTANDKFLSQHVKKEGYGNTTQQHVTINPTWRSKGCKMKQHL